MLSCHLGELFIHRLSPDDNGFQVRQRSAEGGVLLELLVVFEHEHLRLAVFGDVLASLGSVGRVYPGGNATGQDCTIISNQPLGLRLLNYASQDYEFTCATLTEHKTHRVESDDVDGLEARDPEVDQSLGESAALVVVLLPGPCAPLPRENPVLCSRRMDNS